MLQFTIFVQFCSLEQVLEGRRLLYDELIMCFVQLIIYEFYRINFVALTDDDSVWFAALVPFLFHGTRRSFMIDYKLVGFIFFLLLKCVFDFLLL